LVPLVTFGAVGALAVIVVLGSIRGDMWRGEDVSFVFLVAAVSCTVRYVLGDESDVQEKSSLMLPEMVVRLAALGALLMTLNPLANALDLRPDSFARIAFCLGATFAAFALVEALTRLRA
jgi:hypothetical protein